MSAKDNRANKKKMMPHFKVGPGLDFLYRYQSQIEKRFQKTSDKCR